MALFWHRKQIIEEDIMNDILADKEVEAIKRPTHLASRRALRSAEQLKSLLKADGITLKIHIATHGNSHGK